MNHKDKWWAGMRKKLGVETNAEVSAFMRESGAKATRTGTGGFAYLKIHAPDRLKEISIKGGKYSGKDKIS